MKGEKVEIAENLNFHLIELKSLNEENKEKLKHFEKSWLTFWEETYKDVDSIDSFDSTSFFKRDKLIILEFKGRMVASVHIAKYDIHDDNENFPFWRNSISKTRFSNHY